MERVMTDDNTDDNLTCYCKVMLMLISLSLKFSLNYRLKVR